MMNVLKNFGLFKIDTHTCVKSKLNLKYAVKNCKQCPKNKCINEKR